ncbi:MAG: imelysin family protein [Brumimicrobium sp.]|nr:imelysin family protein [Brumimicrobium sp.]
MGFRSIIILTSLVGIVFLGCKKTEEETPDFNKGQLLTNVSGQIILPSLNDFDSDLSDLQTSFMNFRNDRTAANLEIVRNDWKKSYLTFQTVKIFDLGPIKNNGFKASTATYPTDTLDIRANISAGSYNLGSAANVDAIGLPALDYLFFQPNALVELQNNEDYLNYVEAVINKMKSESTLVLDQWQGYKATFDASTGTSSTSSFSELVNEFNRDYELAKNAKVGIPIGKKSLGIPMPEYVEARYSGFSFELLDASIKALTKVFNGNSYETSNPGVGFDDYLVHLDKESLKTTINTNFTAIQNKIDTFSSSLEVEIQQNMTGLDELYLLLQQQVVYIKTDMTSAFGVLITYQDNDGD